MPDRIEKLAPHACRVPPVCCAKWYCSALAIKETMSLSLNVGNSILECNKNWISAPSFPIFVEWLEHLRTSGPGVFMMSSLNSRNCSKNGGYVQLCLSLSIRLAHSCASLFLSTFTAPIFYWEKGRRVVAPRTERVRYISQFQSERDRGRVAVHDLWFQTEIIANLDPYFSFYFNIQFLIDRWIKDFWIFTYRLHYY